MSIINVGGLNMGRPINSAINIMKRITSLHVPQCKMYWDMFAKERLILTVNGMKKAITAK